MYIALGGCTPILPDWHWRYWCYCLGSEAQMPAVAGCRWFKVLGSMMQHARFTWLHKRYGRYKCLSHEAANGRTEFRVMEYSCQKVILYTELIPGRVSCWNMEPTERLVPGKYCASTFVQVKDKDRVSFLHTQSVLTGTWGSLKTRSATAEHAHRPPKSTQDNPLGASNKSSIAEHRDLGAFQ